MRKQRKLLLGMTSLAILLLVLLPLSSTACGGDREEAPLGKIAFVTNRDGNHEIYVMDTDGSDLTRLTDNTHQDSDPVWRPFPGTPGPTPTPQVTMPPPFRPPVEIYAAPVKGTYLLGEPVTIEFSFKNVAAEPVRVWPLLPKIDVMRPRPYEAVRSFPAGSEQVHLKPGETASYTLVWDQKDTSGRQVAPGGYFIHTWGGYIEGAELGTMALGDTAGAGFWIQYPQGPMEKSIWVNQSRTADGLTITLERVELSATGGEVYAFTAPPNFDPSQGPPGPPQQSEMTALAQYSVDGDPVKRVGYMGSRVLEDGMELFWHDLDPIPSDAEVLIFTITEVTMVTMLFTTTGPNDLTPCPAMLEWSGPWEFEILLQ